MRTLIASAMFACTTIVSLAAFAQDAPPADPPEVKQTVDAFVGKWKAKTTLTLPDGKTVDARETIECKKAAMGRAVHCVDHTTVPGMGKTEFQYLIAYDVDSRSVHLFAVGSTGEVHDHKCTWSDDKTLGCETLKGSSGGAPLSEDLGFSWTDAKTLNMNATIVNKDGTVKIAVLAKRK
jgi:hypothetical protein